MALTKADFAAQLLDELGLSKPMAKDLVEFFLRKAIRKHPVGMKPKITKGSASPP